MQHSGEALGESFDHGAGEPGSGVPEASGESGLGLVDDDLEIELRLGDVDAARGDVTGLEFHGGSFVVPEREQDLKERVSVDGTRGLHCVHHPFERNVRVSERVEVSVAYLDHEVLERDRRVDVGPQYDGSDEHTDEGIEQRVRSAGYRCSDGDVPGATGFGEHGGERCMDDDEHRCAQTMCERPKSSEVFGAEGERHRRRLVRGIGDAGRKFEEFGYSGEGAPPEFELLGGHRVQHVLLPQSIVRVLDRQRIELGSRAGHSGQQRDLDVSGQCA